MAERGAPAGAGPDRAGLGIYVHWPFCLAKCPYCDFNSHVRERIDHGRWRAALVRELEHFAAETAGRPVSTLFFGGGTPSLMQPDTVDQVIRAVRAAWPVSADVEISLEANPTSVEAARFEALAAAGVNRLSIGVQALDDADLAGLGRGHDAAQARAAVALAQRCVDRVSLDLIYARPRQGVARWRRELAAALELFDDLGRAHLSVYQLTIEPGTRFHALHRRGALALPSERVTAALFEATQRDLEAAGLPAYEVSNHAAPGHACRHNLTYWRYRDYVGVGPGAHGRLSPAGPEHGKLALRQHRAPEAWLAAVERHGHATRARRLLDPGERLAELLLMGLRLRDGVPRARIARETGMATEAALDGQALADLVDAGLLEDDGRALRATPAGLQRLDAVLRHLLARPGTGTVSARDRAPPDAAPRRGARARPAP